MRKIFLQKKYSLVKKIALTIFSLTYIFVAIFFHNSNAYAVFNKQINYQGKLTNSSSVAVPDGSYNMELALYTVDSGGTAIWTETRIEANRVAVANGLFSILLGEVSSLASIDFNQTLYLGVNIGGTTNTPTPTWDGEMAPRKKLGSVPAAFEAVNALTATAGFTVSGGNLVSPILVGGSGTTQDLTLQTTTGVGASGADMHFLVGNNGGTEAMTILNDGNMGIGILSPSAVLHLKAGTASAGTGPLKFTAGANLTSPESGTLEFDGSNYFGSVESVGTNYTSQYPSAHSSTYVKSTSSYSANFEPWFATDPAKSLTGDWTNTQWVSGSGSPASQRLHIDLGSATVIKRIYYENSHTSGGFTTTGAKNFTLWGSNDSSAFSDTTYGSDTNWTQLSTSASQFDQHAASNTADPKYITVTNSTAYRYYAIKIADNWGYADYMGIRRIELQTADSVTADRLGLVMDNGTRLTSGRMPYITTDGRLKDTTNFVFDGTNLGIGDSSPDYMLDVAGTAGFDGLLTATAGLNISNGATSAGVLTLLEDTDDGSNFASFQVPALAANTVYVLPANDGDASQVLTTNGSGTLSWAAASAGTPTAITVANEAADTTSFISFFTAATGDLGPKTNAALTFDASTAKLSATQLGSTATTGTAPLTVASTTVVTNLNADYLDGLDGSAFTSLINDVIGKTSSLLGFAQFGGDGSDGAGPASGALTSDPKQYTSWTITGAVTVSTSAPAGLFVGVQGTLTLDTGGSISANGKGHDPGSPLNTTTGIGENCLGNVSQTMEGGCITGAGGGGGADSANADGAAGGGAGGTGGTGATHAGVSGGAAGTTSVAKKTAARLVKEYLFYNPWASGRGLVAGAGGGTGRTYGTGGMGGGIIYIEADTVTITPTTAVVTANGENAANDSSGNGGGGGGGGGLVWIRARTLSGVNTTTVTANGGTGGTSTTGSAGGNGAAGAVIIEDID
ncbi:MAG: DUF5000 domain-containing lipoprotein [Candidatus Paceibacterota bacterium]